MACPAVSDNWLCRSGGQKQQCGRTFEMTDRFELR